MAGPLKASSSLKRPALLHLVGGAAIFSLIVFAIQSSRFTGTKKLDTNREEVQILSHFQAHFQQCVANWGLGLHAHIIDHCKLGAWTPRALTALGTMNNSKYLNLWSTIMMWEQVGCYLKMQYRNMTTVLTRGYLDARPDGWLEYAAKRIAQLVADECYNRSLCEEHLNIILPAKPPFHARQFKTCAVVGNSGDLLKMEFGEEIDSHDAVIRDNEAPFNELMKYLLSKV